MRQHHGRARVGKKASSVVPLVVVLCAGACVVPVACGFQTHGLLEGTTSGGGGPIGSGPGPASGATGTGGEGVTTGGTGGATTGASSVAASSTTASSTTASSTTASSSSGGPTSEGDSCNAIYQANAAAPSGLHLIDPKHTGTPYQVYCQMITSGNDAGGWTLALKIDGTQQTFAYDAAPWTDTTPFGNPDLNQSEGKLPSFYEVAMVKVRVGMYGADSTYRWMTLPDSLGGGGKTLKDVIAAAPATTAGQAAWEGLVQNVATQAVICTPEGFNLTGYNFHLRLGFLEDNGTGCPSANTYIGFGPNWFTAANSPHSDGPASGNFRDSFGGSTHTVIPTWGYVLVR